MNINRLSDFPDMILGPVRKMNPAEARNAVEEYGARRFTNAELPLWFCAGQKDQECTCCHQNRTGRAPYLKGIGYTPEEAMQDALAQMEHWFGLPGNDPTQLPGPPEAVSPNKKP